MYHGSCDTLVEQRRFRILVKHLVKVKNCSPFDFARSTLLHKSVESPSFLYVPCPFTISCFLIAMIAAGIFVGWLESHVHCIRSRELMAVVSKDDQTTSYTIHRRQGKGRRTPYCLTLKEGRINYERPQVDCAFRHRCDRSLPIRNWGCHVFLYSQTNNLGRSRPLCSDRDF